MQILIILLTTLRLALVIYSYMLFIYIILGWLPDIRGSRIYVFFDRIASPFMHYFSGWLVIGMMDFTPILGFIFLNLVVNGLNEIIAIL